MADDIVYIPFKEATILTSCIMAGGFILCIVLALVYHFERTTWTHCGVPNYLPSISAAISVPPSAYIWRLVVALCASQRLCTVSFHYKHYSSNIGPNRRGLCKLCFGSEVLENLCLVGLTCISSVENHDLHKIFFSGFQLFSTTFMALMCIVYGTVKHQDEAPTLENWQRNSLRWKKAVFLANILAFLAAMFVYYLHNTYCQPGVYTIFALLEYLIVLSNVGFHTCVSLDFGDREIHFGVRKSNKTV